MDDDDDDEDEDDEDDDDDDDEARRRGRPRLELSSPSAGQGKARPRGGGGGGRTTDARAWRAMERRERRRAVMETVEEAFLRGYSDSRCAGARARRLTTVDDG